MRVRSCSLGGANPKIQIPVLRCERLSLLPIRQTPRGKCGGGGGGVKHWLEGAHLGVRGDGREGCSVFPFINHRVAPRLGLDLMGADDSMGCEGLWMCGFRGVGCVGGFGLWRLCALGLGGGCKKHMKQLSAKQLTVRTEPGQSQCFLADLAIDQQ